MKTIKITENVHKRLIAEQNEIYKKDNVKPTLSQVIDIVLTFKEVLVGKANETK